MTKGCAVASVLLSVMSCEMVLMPSEGEASALVRMIFSADYGPETRTTLQDDGRTVFWSEGDAISLFAGDDASNRKFIASGVEGTIADFEGYADGEASSYTALYPYRYGASMSSETVKTVLPNRQGAVEGSFADDLNIAVARMSGTHLSFRNVCSLIKVTVPEGIDDVRALTLVSRVPLAGEMKITFDEEGNPSMAPVSTTAGKELTMDAGGETLAPGDYYFVISPGEHKFSLGVTTTADELYTMYSKTQAVVDANDVISLGQIRGEGSRGFRLKNLPSAPVSVDDTWKIEYEVTDPSYEGLTVSFKSRDAKVITSATDGNIVFGGRPGVAMVNVEYDGITYPVAFDVRAWYRDGVDRWTKDETDTPNAVVETSANSYGETCHQVTLDSNGKGYLKRSAKIWPSPVGAPVLCVRMDDLADNGYDRSIILNFAKEFKYNGVNFTGMVGNAKNGWLKKYRCSDGSSIFVYDLSAQQVGEKMLPADFHADGYLQLKYADVKLNGLAASGASYRFFGFRSYGSLSDMEQALDDWSAQTGITYVDSENDDDEVVTQPTHPCALVSAADIERVRESVNKASPSDPVYASYQAFCDNKYSQSSYTASPVATLVRGDVAGTGVESENYMNAARDAAAAFQLALRWQISGQTQYADAAVDVLNAWASTCTQITANDNNQYLAAGFQGYTFANAAELLRDYPGWASSDQDSFKTWLRTVWLAKNEWFIDTHGGENNCNLHYWSNWELANLASMLAIGIYLEDSVLIDKVRMNFLRGEDSGCISNMIPYAPVADPDGYGQLAQSMESGRDQGHTTLVVSMCAELCQMAWNVGLDFWGQDSNKVLAMAQYTAKYNAMPEGAYLCETMPFTAYTYCGTGCGCANTGHGAYHTEVSADGRGTLRPCWDLIYSHYRHQKQVSADDVHYVKIFADQLRYTDGKLTGDGGSGDSRYGTNSGAFDQIGWGTMLFWRGE